MIEKLLHLAREEIMQMTPYSSARREHASAGIYLNANENPYTKANHINRYPSPQPEALRERLADLYQVNPAQILMTRGSDEGIDLWLRTFCRAGVDAVMVCPPTYDMYGLSATIQHASIITVPLLPDTFALDIKQIQEKWQDNCKLLFLCSPNNPTANVFAREDILALCQLLEDKAIIIVDEAYIEFANHPSMSADLAQYPNLAVLRTLSKAYGMAGARCGAVLAHPQLIQLLEKVLSPYPLPSPVIQLVLQELSEKNLIHVSNQIATLKEQREKMADFLKQQSFVEKVWPSEANFILLKVNHAERLVAHCAKHHIIIRNRTHMLGLENCVRISIGTSDENQQLQSVLESYEPD